MLNYLLPVSMRGARWPGGSRGQGFEPPLGSPCFVLEQDIFTPQKVLVIPRKRWLRPNMTEKLFTRTLSIKPKPVSMKMETLLEFICNFIQNWLHKKFLMVIDI